MKNVLLLLLLVGCAAEPQAFSGPNKRAAYNLRCSSPIYCYEQAAKLCQAGYDIVSDPRGPHMAVECR